ncbi:DUF4448 domain-containing protein [Aspergillus homomorphus CBS 101889]|uniref:Uncharacterized protein n=1 Tax=Aspergillus homomorphus (strain CBS 101889) TaxID=1450537 RepID=A0A395HU55_ASPHC|nr:hypothetical protein BO97DRAFT_427166 [Aspergillus homomorphus CBS 101889]RAL09744.1 hypothetical protein BO97DRAFT_427166 [Aspergillus homomorphus CBS 101889]
MAFAVLITFCRDIGAMAGEDTGTVTTLVTEFACSQAAPTPIHKRSTVVSPGDFPICTDLSGPFRPFCLPEDGTEVTVDATYYVTWNADFYPLNATITIELRYLNSSEGDSAYTSERIDNSYGYTHIRMREGWLQGKQRNALTLYIIELDAVSNKRASARQGPTILLHIRPTEHRKPSPQLPFNRLALYIGLPVSLGVVILVVAGLYFGMRESRQIDLANIMSCGEKGYGIAKSRNQRLGSKADDCEGSDASSALGRYTDEIDSGMSEMLQSEHCDLDHNASFAFRRDSSKLRSWRV